MSCQLIVLYYSRHGNTRALARQIARGIETVPNCEALLRTVEEFNAEDTAQDPIITLNELAQCDGLALGSPVWFGNMAAPLKHLWDQTTGLWISGSLIDKPACVFSSSSSMHGGQETTLQSMHLPLLHHGMMILGIPYSEPELHTTRSGGTPYGATSVNSTSQRLTPEESKLAQRLGQRLARTALKLKDD
ncbi:NAD(P)H:quinone oxidoreductase [Vibrio sinensis]|uniref:NAD(P)H:quinone oxidoreductase n=1 Tax=Vibrio sinensis TaxID=2302434 RepID=A0A3A6R3X1_9VIBR|nr:NAD(P)H:quinone oxidoreductase [Vibrio sinensis]RJX71600.1 NAD(P)H:quinone oxidoreductase [Vibrio sinensis]